VTHTSRSAGLAPDAARSTAVRTFLIADIRGYTRFTQEHGDEEAAKLVAQFAALAREAVGARGGEVIELRGDEAVGVFPSARQAVRGAVELQARFAQLAAATAPSGLPVGIGLDAGEAIPVEGGYRGAALNLAARLCGLAGPGEVLASEAVVHLAGKMKGLAYAERGHVQLKGLAEPVRVVQVTPEPEPLKTPEGDAEPPVAPLPIGGFLGALPTGLLVAREAELARIFSVVDAVTQGTGQLLFLAGESGIGKTRLAQEVMLNVRNRRFVVAAGRCYEQHQSVPFYPFLDALAAAYAACPPGVRAAVPGRWPQLSRLLPELKVDMRIAASNSQEEQQRLFRAVTEFLKAIAAESPVALLLDDLHWGDSASLELLQHLAQHTRADRILVLGTYRDAEVSRRHPLEGALRNLTREDLVVRLPVGRLEQGGTTDLIAATLGQGNVPAAFAELVQKRTEGNPFFVQQLLRFFVERGDVYQQDGRWTQRSLDAIEVPDSVRSVIGQRLTRLSEPTQEVLGEASVLGQTFTFSALAEVAGRPEDVLEEALDEAELVGLVRETGPDTYAFDHALTQQALYVELPGRRKRKLHLAAAEALERLPQGSRLRRNGELAWHFLESANEPRALPYAVAAGDQAAEVFAHREAERYYTTALEIAEHLGDREREAEILRRRAALLLGTFQGKEAVRDYERLVDGARGRGDRTQELAALLGLARASYIVAMDETEMDLASKCRDMYDAAYELARELRDEQAMARALLGTKWFGDFWPQYEDRYMDNAQQALAISQRLGDEELILDCQLATWRSGRRPDAEAMGAKLVTQLKERRELHRLNELYFSMMWAHLRWGSFERCIETCDAGIKLAAEIGVPPVQYPTLKALALLQLGQYGETWQALQREVTDEAHAFGQAMQVLGAGMYYFELLAYERAAEVFRDLIARGTRLRRAWMRSWGGDMLARSLLRTGTLDAAMLAQIQADLDRIGLRLAQVATAEILLANRKPDEALPHAEAAAELARQREELPEYVTSLEVKSRILQALGQAAEAAAAAGAALTIATELRAMPMVWRLQVANGRALLQLEKMDGAAAAFRSAAETIQGVASSINDPALKPGFLTSPEVASILRQWA
jgi:class 3 adenylate cyclase